MQTAELNFKTQMTVNLDSNLKNLLVEIADKEKRSLNFVAVQLMTEALAARSKAANRKK